MKRAFCHPLLKYHARGMCKACYQQKWSEANRDKNRAAQRRYQKNNPDKNRDNRRREYLRNIERKRSYHKVHSQKPEVKKYNKHNRLVLRYGIGLSRYEELFRDQGGACAICSKTDGFGGLGHNLRVDHDHARNEVRGLLCNRCNTGLGYLENSEWYERAVEYLRKYDALREVPISA